jgi:hypothetical protein
MKIEGGEIMAKITPVVNGYLVAGSFYRTLAQAIEAAKEAGNVNA